MRLNLRTLAKSYIFCLALANCIHVFSLLGIVSAVSRPLSADLWWWHAVLFLTYMILPYTAILADNYALYATVAGFSLVRIIAEALRVFAWSVDLYTILVPLYALAAISSLVLAVEKVASEVSAEILSLEWSQF
jgi:hypothetical protein